MVMIEEKLMQRVKANAPKDTLHTDEGNGTISLATVVSVADQYFKASLPNLLDAIIVNLNPVMMEVIRQGFDEFRDEMTQLFNRQFLVLEEALSFL